MVQLIWIVSWRCVIITLFADVLVAAKNHPLSWRELEGLISDVHCFVVDII